MVVAAKVQGRIIITRIRDGIDNKLRQEQAGFRKGHGTTEQYLYCATSLNYFSRVTFMSAWWTRKHLIP